MSELKTWCAQCGPDVGVDEDGGCQTCGATSIGAGADAAHHWRDLARGVTDAELDEIEARAAACFVGPWSAETWEVECPGEEECGPCGNDHTLETVTAPEEYPRDPKAPQVVAQVDGWIRTSGLERFARTHAAFIAAARTDVPALVAEVRRLRAALERAKWDFADIDDLGGSGRSVAVAARNRAERALRPPVAG